VLQTAKPTASVCEEGPDTAAHFVHPLEIKSVHNLVRFSQKSYRFS